MRSFTPGRRLGLAVAVTLLLASGSACSSDRRNRAVGAVRHRRPVRPQRRPGRPLLPRVDPAQRHRRRLPPPASTAVPPPTPGNVESTVESKPEESKKPVKLDKPSKTGTGLSAELVRIKAIEAEAQLPGEIAGPALAITIEVSNTGDQAADLSTVVVTLLNSDDAPGNEMSTKPREAAHRQGRARQDRHAARTFSRWPRPSATRSPSTSPSATPRCWSSPATPTEDVPAPPLVVLQSVPEPKPTTDPYVVQLIKSLREAGVEVPRVLLASRADQPVRRVPRALAGDLGPRQYAAADAGSAGRPAGPADPAESDGTTIVRTLHNTSRHEGGARRRPC